MTLAIRPFVPLACAASVWAFVAGAPSVRAVAQDAGGTKEPHSTVSLFTHSENCVACHNNLSTAAGEDVSIGVTWRSSMMANSARDPYWQASVRRETIDHPTHAADIQDECAACHMPMTQRMARAANRKGEVFSELPFPTSGDPDRRLAADGISCTVCHQIAPDRLGTRESFNANFVMRPTPPDGARVIFGPYAVDAGRKTIMRSSSGFVQTEEAPHVKQSELCASCHTLITEAYGPDGAVVGTLPEQMNYQEWQHSDFNREQRSCQSCHMPAAPGPIRVSSVLGDERESLARHLFVGGNAHMLRLLNRYRTELGVSALPAELEATAQATLRQLQQDTATLAVSTPRSNGGRLAFDVDVRNLSGHKFPTGYPSRRAWLHVTVTDGGGATVFESGAIDDAGLIAGNANDADPLRYEPHYEQVTQPDQVQIYEPILGGLNGVPTTGLLTATQYLKDNRLLPRGFDKNTAPAEVGVYGAAARDEDFAGAGDRVRYEVGVPSAGPYTVRVELRYQSIGYRWAQNLAPYDAPEPKRFVTYYRATSPDSSVVVATATTRTGAGVR